MHTGNEDVQEIQNVVTKKDEKQEKGGSTREVQDLPFLNHDQPASSSSADEHSPEVNYLGCTVVYRGKNFILGCTDTFSDPKI